MPLENELSINEGGNLDIPRRIRYRTTNTQGHRILMLDTIPDENRFAIRWRTSIDVGSFLNQIDKVEPGQVSEKYAKATFEEIDRQFADEDHFNRSESYRYSSLVHIIEDNPHFPGFCTHMAVEGDLPIKRSWDMKSSGAYVSFEFPTERQSIFESYFNRIALDELDDVYQSVLIREIHEAIRSDLNP